jgi:hypothetical protein
VIPADPGYALRDTERGVQRLEVAHKDLDNDNGWGTWKGNRWATPPFPGKTPCGNGDRVLGRPNRPAGGNHGLLRRADRAAEREGPLREAFERLAGPERERLEAELPEAKKLYDELGNSYAGHVHYEVAHPEALRRLDLADIQINSASWELDVEREGLDGIATRTPQLPQPSRRLERDIEISDRGIELEL